MESGISKVDATPTRRVSAAFTGEEKRRIFKSMVVAELEVGFLRYSKREALLRYAQTLGIGEFDAMLLMAEAQHHAGEIEPIHFDPGEVTVGANAPASWPISRRISFALVAAICIDLALIYWICR